MIRAWTGSPTRVDFLVGPIRATEHRGGDDLLSAGLRLAGLRGGLAEFADATAPTAGELRRRAIQCAWKGITDLGALGGYGDVYGGVPDVPGREYTAFARLPAARSPHRVLVQIPDSFDSAARCLIVTASSGSRGIYGGIAVAGAWGLSHACAVAHTDKGAGSGYFDCADSSGVALDGTRAQRGAAILEFDPCAGHAQDGIAIKHAHSQDNPEADWGRHMLQTAQFGLAMLGRAFPQLAPFTPDNTRIIVVGLSNGGGAALQAAGLDDAGWLDGVVAIEPSVYAPAGSGARPLYDYAGEAAIWLPCALGEAYFDTVPFARAPGTPSALCAVRGAALWARGLVAVTDAPAQASAALEHLRREGWTDAVLATAASTTCFDLWRTLLVTYSSAYARAAIGAMPGSFHFAPLAASGEVRMASRIERAAWWSEGSGIAPGNGICVVEPGRSGTDAALPGIATLAGMWHGDDEGARTLRRSILATAAHLPRADLPIFVLHGEADGLIPACFSSTPYVEWLRINGRNPQYWLLPHVQHFDAFCALPAFGDRYLPMLPYAYAAIERMFRHVTAGTPLATRQPVPTPRGAAALDRGKLDLDGMV